MTSQEDVAYRAVWVWGGERANWTWGQWCNVAELELSMQAAHGVIS